MQLGETTEGKTTNHGVLVPQETEKQKQNGSKNSLRYKHMPFAFPPGCRLDCEPEAPPGHHLPEVDHRRQLQVERAREVHLEAAEQGREPPPAPARL